MTESAPEQNWIGTSPRRQEDPRLLQGEGHFVDDIKTSGLCHLNLVRSPYAHAEIMSVETSRAEEHPDVLAVVTGEDMRQHMDPLLQIGGDPGNKIQDFAMPAEKVRYQGDPVAAVVATNRRSAADAAELVEVRYDALDAVTDAEQALEDDVVIHESMGTNKIFDRTYDYGNVDRAFDKAEHVLEIARLKFDRFTAAPLENNAVVADWEADGDLTFHCNSSFPAVALQFLGMALGVPASKTSVQTADIGGSFGIKTVNHNYMAIAAVASRVAGRPAKWVETRSENLTGSAHSNERLFKNIRVALDPEGKITAFEANHLDDVGAYTRLEPQGAVLWGEVPTGNYQIPNLRIDFQAAVTNKCPVGPVRGYSRMQHIWFVERLLDIAGRELGISPDEMRRRNYVPADDFPWETPNKNVYDSGDYHAMLEKAQEVIGWEEWRDKIEAARREDRWMGIGIGTTLDGGTNNFSIAQVMDPQAPFSGQSEAARVSVEMDGSLHVRVGSAPAGQGHETTTAQVVADELNIPPDAVNVSTGFDSDSGVYTGHSGTYASQFAVTGLSAVHGALERLKQEIKEVGAWALRAESPSKMHLGLGEEGPEVRDSDSGNTLPLWQMANLVFSNSADLPEEMAEEVDLKADYVFRPDFGEFDAETAEGKLCLTYAAQLTLVVIEVDKDTYNPIIHDLVVVDDCGTVINPQIVEGLVQGSVCHGLGSALLERCEYDETGNMVNNTFSDYVPMTSVNMPDMECETIETPSPFTYNGAKGMGEGCGAPTHAVAAALQDALHEEGIVIQHSHNDPSSLHEALQQGTTQQWEEVVHKVR